MGMKIVEAIGSRTDAVIAVGEGVVYPVLHGLESSGALRSRRKTVSGRSRILLFGDGGGIAAAGRAVRDVEQSDGRNPEGVLRGAH